MPSDATSADTTRLRCISTILNLTSNHHKVLLLHTMLTMTMITF